MSITPPSQNIDVLYEDEYTLVVCKPSGLLTQAPPGIDSMEVRIKNYLKQDYLGVPHRLDRAASGTMVFAKTLLAAQRLALQFQTHQVEKKYWILIQGCPAIVQCTWTDWMRKVSGEARVELTSKDSPDAKQAILDFKILKEHQAISLLEITLHTGRMHQIRLQAGSRGLPILGDTLYGSTLQFGEQHDDVRLRSIALHARSLRFLHPKKKEFVFCESPLPVTWNDYLNIS